MDDSRKLAGTAAGVGVGEGGHDGREIDALDPELAGLDKSHATGLLGVSAQRRLDSAQKRYLAAIEQLALVRKLLPPPLAPLEVSRRLGRQTGRRRPGEPVAGGAIAVFY